MVPQSPDERAIEKHTRELLQRADARGRFPTPIDDIVAAADLTLPRESLFSGSVLDEAPSHLRRAMKRLTGRVRAVLDRKAREVHVDPSIQNQGRAAFQKLHEVTHDILPWQKELGYADDDATLAATVKELFEQEANIGASNLLFQLDYFDDLVGQYRIGMASILDLAVMVGASGHATFRRFVKAHPTTVAGVVMELSPCSRDPLGYRRREVIVSAKWGEQFGSAYCGPLSSKLLRTRSSRSRNRRECPVSRSLASFLFRTSVTRLSLSTWRSIRINTRSSF